VIVCDDEPERKKTMNEMTSEQFKALYNWNDARFSLAADDLPDAAETEG